MNDVVGVREALIIEAIGEAANLIESVQRLTPELQALTDDIDRANKGLHSSLAGFEAQVLALTEKAKVQAVKHILSRTDEAARRSIELQGRAMADAARVAFGAEVGATMSRLQTALQPLIERSQQRWVTWATHGAAAAAGSAVTSALALWFDTR